MDKDLKKIIKQVDRKGYVVVPAGKHQKVEGPGRENDLHPSNIPEWQLVARTIDLGVEKERSDRLMEFTLDVHTIAGLADPDFVDRLAEIVYDQELLIDPTIGLNADGSLDISFCFEAANATDAVDGVTLLVDALTAASPTSHDPVGSIKVARAEPRKAVTA